VSAQKDLSVKRNRSPLLRIHRLHLHPSTPPYPSSAPEPHSQRSHLLKQPLEKSPGSTKCTSSRDHPVRIFKSKHARVVVILINIFRGFNNHVRVYNTHIFEDSRATVCRSRILAHLPPSNVIRSLALFHQIADPLSSDHRPSFSPPTPSRTFHSRGPAQSKWRAYCLKERP